MVEKNTKSIGNFCSLATGSIVGPNNHPMGGLSTSAVFYSSSWGIVSKNDDKRDFYNREMDTIIKNDVWVGANAIVLGGVTVGNGAVIGAGAVVTKNIPDFAIVVGIPAKIIGYRFEKPLRDALLESNWWNIEDFPLEKEDLDIMLKKFSEICIKYG